MRTPLRSSRALLAAIAALGGFLGSSYAQSVATAPVGAITTSINSFSDQRTGITLERPAVFASTVSSVSTNSITVAGSVPSLSSASYIRVKSGSAAGQWIAITSVTGNTINLSESPTALGISASNNFEIRPFWTLASLFPNGGGVPASSDITSPVGLVLLNDPSAVGINLPASSVYFYHDGSTLTAGWYNNDGSFEAAGDVIVSPESSITLNNSTGSIASVVTVGDVPVVKQAISVLRRSSEEQDNLIYNPYPAPLTLSQSNLDTSGAVSPSSDITSPTDLLLVYSSSSVGTNPAATDVYFYHDGSQLTAGWYKNDGSFESANTIQLAPGAAIVIRKSGGATQVVEWTPTVPYTL